MRRVLSVALVLAFAQGLAAAELDDEVFEDATREEFTAIYADMLRGQLEMSRVLLGRTDSAVAAFVDTETPLSEAERAVGGCLYDVTTEEGDYDDLVDYVQETMRIARDLIDDARLDYVTLVFDRGWTARMGRVSREVDLEILRQCDALRFARRFELSSEAWAVILEAARARGLPEDG